MYVLWVTPISTRIRVHTLTYYTAESVSVGSLIEVPVRSKKVPALVTHIETVTDAKTFLRQSGFRARRLADLAPQQIFSPPLMQAVRHIARFHATTLGTALHECIPQAILAHPEPLPTQSWCMSNVHEKKAIQAPYNERLDTFKTLIRETFALKQSVVLIASTTR